MLLFICAGCDLEDKFLDAKPNQSLVIPTTLDDYEKLLNNNDVFNLFTDPAYGTICADEYYVTSTAFNATSVVSDRNAYIWAKDIIQGDINYENDWRIAYTQVYYANTILEGIEKVAINPSQQEQFDKIKGMALFFRAWAFYNLVQIYAMPYDPITSKTDLGIPLRLTADLNVKSTRPSVQQCYDQVINDLKKSLLLLPDAVPYKTLPSGLAAKGFLSRIYLAISDYNNAFNYANEYLNQNSELTYYNTLSPKSSSIHTTFLSEDSFHTSISTHTINSRTRALLDPSFVASYADNDLRKSYLFTRNTAGDFTFKGSYNYNGFPYSGIATDEIYLIHAECNARSGNAEAALNDLNTLLRKRWKSGTEFIPYQASNADEALVLVLNERKKELLFRGLRWTDLRRLNKEERFKVTLTRSVNQEVYTLQPGDPRYALPLPQSETSLNGLEQNQR